MPPGKAVAQAMSELHNRGVSIALALLDETLCNLELWAKGREAHGVLYHEHNALSPQEREGVLSAVRQIREVLEEVRKKLSLDPKIQDVASMIWGWAWTTMEPVEELQGRFLRRYGEPPAELVRYLDPKVARLCELLGTIQRIASGARNRPAAPDRLTPEDGEQTRGRAKGSKKG